ncbi:unnamed protein product [Dibothriocephalus latus]|uniref:Uncharacterized protein n=1 Tax=Dibothriocephalus latus TaxID=60516 RepID=A0A3P6P0V8_DIBLA|nr:unnamed protein product [Dibothriocephalus latus]
MKVLLRLIQLIPFILVSITSSTSTTFVFNSEQFANWVMKNFLIAADAFDILDSVEQVHGAWWDVSTVCLHLWIAGLHCLFFSNLSGEGNIASFESEHSSISTNSEHSERESDASSTSSEFSGSADDTASNSYYESSDFSVPDTVVRQTNQSAEETGTLVTVSEDRRSRFIQGLRRVRNWLSEHLACPSAISNWLNCVVFDVKIWVLIAPIMLQDVYFLCWRCYIMHHGYQMDTTIICFITKNALLIPLHIFLAWVHLRGQSDEPSSASQSSPANSHSSA